MKKRDIYISPSVQEHNLYYDKKHTEEDVMNLIADVVVAELKKTAAFNIFRNKKTFTLAEIIADSNKYLNAGEGDLHIALHSNAGGGRGCTAFSFAENAQSDYFAHSIYNQIEPLTPTKDRGVKPYPALAEIGKTQATSCLIEIAFHDNKDDANFILNNIEKIGKAIAKGICNYAKVTYPVPVPATKSTIKVGGKVKLVNAPLYNNSYGGTPKRYVTNTFVVEKIIKNRAAGVLLSGKYGWVSEKNCIPL